MELQIIRGKYEAGDILPLEGVVEGEIKATIKIEDLVLSYDKSCAFFKIANATYPDLEDEYFLIYKGLYIKVNIFWYAENESWKIKWYSKGQGFINESDVSETLYKIAIKIGFPHKVVESTNYPMVIKNLVKYPNKNGVFR